MKVAILIGINYTNQKCELNGCLNDVEYIKSLLADWKIEELTDRTELKPTKENILNLLGRYVVKSKLEKIDMLFLYYSGHGTYIKDNSVEGRSECIVPIDFDKNGLIIDDDLNSFISRVNPKTKIRALFDCCYSGSTIDLQYRFYNSQRITKNNYKIKNKDVVFISGCLDNQVSLEYDVDLSSAKKYQGALTCSFNNIKNIKELYADLIKKLKEKKMKQVPQLSMSSLKITNFLE